MKRRGIWLIIIFSIIFIISGCQSKDIKKSPNITINNTNAALNETETNISINNTEEMGNETSNETTNESEASCLDTDGGLDYSKKGTVIVSNGKYRQVQDFCENTGKLVEYYCKEDLTSGVTIYECFSGGEYACSNGVCGTVILNTSNTTNASS